MQDKVNKTIKKVNIKGFKVFEEETFEFKNLTILTGENSSGKSSLIQAILFLCNPTGLIGTNFNKDLHEYLRSLGNSELFNKNGAREIEIEIDDLKQKWIKNGNSIKNQIDSFNYPNFISYPENLIYLNAEKHRIQQVSQLIENLQDRFFGIYGDLTSNYFYHNKRKAVEDYLIKDTSSVTLEAQVNYWLSYITGINDLNIEINKITPTLVKNIFKINNDEFIPENLGTGLSHLFSMLVICLSAKKGNIIIIENPEIHLHPKSQARLGEFFAFIASKGIQLIIETHNDHIINRFRYEVYQDNLKSDDVVIYYKELDKSFEKIEITDDGKFKNKNGENSFPSGFYDATLKEIFKINKGQ
jgi:predicted ATPase